jgi:predicted CxxxxCH...CXXCH cytochrome family protein
VTNVAGSHYTHDTLQSYACESCHADVLIAAGTYTGSRATHADGGVTADQVVFGGTVGYEALAGSYSGGNTCNAVYCHGGTAAVEDGTDITPIWGSAGTGACGACHPYTAATPPTSQAHQQHAGNGAGEQALGCETCHYGTTQDGTSIFDRAVHVDGRSAFAIDPTTDSWSTPAVTYTGAANLDQVNAVWGSCDNLYCHSDVTSQAAGFATPAWNGAVVCGDCHAFPVITDSHQDHTDAARKAYACDVCHEGYGSGTTHADFQVQNSFLTNWNGRDLSEGGATTYSGGTNPFDAFGSCASLYCHGDFNGGIAANTPTWGTTASGDCGTCHNDDTVDQTYESHSTHFNSTYGPNIGTCGTCHGASTLGTATHVNATTTFEDGSEVAIDGINADGTVTTCDNCHGNQSSGGAAAIATAKTEWNSESVNDYSDVTCESCHGQYDVANSLQDGTGTDAIDVATYFAVADGGHSDPNFAVARRRACTDCHDQTGTTHFNVGVQDRIVEADITTFCQTCHDGTGADVEPTVVEIDAAQKSTHGNTNPGYTPPIGPTEPNGGTFATACADCHDPHGTTNIKMIDTTVNATALVFTDRTQFDTVGGPDDICEVCHTVTEHNGGAGGLHSADYRGTDCHGYPPTVGDGFTYGTNSAGVHEVHMNVTATYSCDTCHSGATHGSGSDFLNATNENIADDFVEVSFDAQNGNGIYTGDPTT